jgi:hypothetical protein
MCSNNPTIDRPAEGQDGRKPPLTRTHRVIQASRDGALALRDRAVALRDRVSAKVAGRTLVYLGAGLALAGAGAATAAGLAGGTATAARRSDALDRKAESVLGGQPRSPADHLAKHAKPDVPAPGSRKHPTTPTHTHSAAAHKQSAHFAAKRGVKHDETWQAIARTVAGQTVPAPGHGPLPAQDKLIPTGTSGPQEWMPITPARFENAATIVRQALDKKMGLRSAVIAVATAMQESTLLNINYGDRDSLGLFQQRPSYGWGTPSQILRPAYAADAFLNALRTYQANNPNWASQPLWQPAQGVQASGFPYAYAKWEAQAAQLVGSVTRRLI